MSELKAEALEYFHALDGDLSEDVIWKATWYVHQLYLQNEVDAVMRLWAILQGDLDLLFQLHPYVDDVIVKASVGDELPEGDYSIEGLKAQREERIRQSKKKAKNVYIDDNGVIVVELED